MEKHGNNDSGFTLESKKEKLLISYFVKDPKNDRASVSVLAEGSPLLTIHNVDNLEKNDAILSFYLKGKGFYYDDNLDGIPDRHLSLEGKKMRVQTQVVEFKDEHSSSKLQW